MNTIILISLITLSCLGAEKKEEAQIACIKGLSANVRSEPNLKSSVVANLQKFTPLNVIEVKEQWTKVKSKNFQGWVFNELLVSDLSCVMTLQPEKTLLTDQSEDPHFNRNSVEINEGFKIIKTTIGKTKVEDKYGNTFWLENQYLWPKSELQDLNISL